MRGNRIQSTPLVECVEQTHSIANSSSEREFDRVLQMRGPSFKAALHALQTLIQAYPQDPQPGQDRLKIAIMHSGGPAPGMNTAARAAVRLGLDKGHRMYAVQNGYPGLVRGDLHAMNWMSVRDWSIQGGAELGTNREIPKGGEFYAIAKTLEQAEIDGLIMIGGEAGYDGVYEMYRRRNEFPSFYIPIVCLPATIDNDRPGSELSIGADTALNNIVSAVDRIKQSAVASRRCFIVEVMGGYCGYLALMGGLATGAERVYIHEEGITLNDLLADVEHLRPASKRANGWGW